MSSESQYEPYPYASKVHSWPFLAIPIEEGNNLMEIRLDLKRKKVLMRVICISIAQITTVIQASRGWLELQ